MRQLAHKEGLPFRLPQRRRLLRPWLNPLSKLNPLQAVPNRRPPKLPIRLTLELPLSPQHPLKPDPQERQPSRSLQLPPRQAPELLRLVLLLLPRKLLPVGLFKLKEIPRTQEPSRLKHKQKPELLQPQHRPRELLQPPPPRPVPKAAQN